MSDFCQATSRKVTLAHSFIPPVETGVPGGGGGDRGGGLAEPQRRLDVLEHGLGRMPG